MELTCTCGATLVVSAPPENGHPVTCPVCGRAVPVPADPTGTASSSSLGGTRAHGIRLGMVDPPDTSMAFTFQKALLDAGFQILPVTPSEPWPPHIAVYGRRPRFARFHLYVVAWVEGRPPDQLRPVFDCFAALCRDLAPQGWAGRRPLAGALVLVTDQPMPDESRQAVAEQFDALAPARAGLVFLSDRPETVEVGRGERWIVTSVYDPKRKERLASVDLPGAWYTTFDQARQASAYIDYVRAHLSRPVCSVVLLAALLGMYVWMLGTAFARGSTHVTNTLLLGADHPRLLHDLLLQFGAVSRDLVVAGQYWRLVASIFVHIGLVHLVFNGWALWHLGAAVERHLGAPKFLLVYLGAGLGGSAWSINMQPAQVMMAGASGALFGLAGALLAFVLRNRHEMPQVIYHPYVRRLIVLIVFGVGLGLMVPNIDNWAHVGGLGTGFLLGVVLSAEVSRARRFSAAQVIGTATVCVLIGLVSLLPSRFDGGLRGVVLRGPLKRLVQSEHAEAHDYYAHVIRRLDWLDDRFGQLRDRIILPQLGPGEPANHPTLAQAVARARDCAQQALALVRRNVPQTDALRKVHREARRYFRTQKAYADALLVALRTHADEDWRRVIEAGDDLVDAPVRWREARRRLDVQFSTPDS